jgi:hypothetical protein
VSATIERTIVMSSTILPVCGMISDSSTPDRPHGWNLNGVPISLPFWMFICDSILTSPGGGLPSNSLSTGLGSNKSIWLGPPFWNRQITFLAVGRWSRRGGDDSDGRPPAATGAARSKSARASRPSVPIAVWPRKARRLSAPRVRARSWLL